MNGFTSGEMTSLDSESQRAYQRPHARLLRPQPPASILSEPPYVPPLKSSATARIEQWVTVLVRGVLVGGCYLVLQPFLTAVILAVILCCATWPLFTRLQRVAWGGATLAALLVTLLVALVVLAPVVIVGVSLAQNANELLDHGKRLLDEGPPDPPSWVGQIPIIGERTRAYWASIAHDSTAFILDLKQYIQPLQTFALSSRAAIAQGVLQLTLAVFITFFFYRDGEAMSRRLPASVVRQAAQRG